MPKDCFARGEILDRENTEDARDDALVLFERACRGGVARGCIYAARIIHDDRDSSAEQNEHGDQLLARGCNDLADGAACYVLAGRNQDDLRLLDRACRLGSEMGCLFGGYQRSDSPSRAERERAIVALGPFCRQKNVSACEALARAHTANGDTDGARSAAHGACELGNQKACVSLAFDYAVGRGVAQDPKLAEDLATKACDRSDCDALDAIRQWSGAPEPKALALVVEGKVEHFVIDLPPGITLTRGLHVQRATPGLVVNGTSSFEAEVIEASPGHAVLHQRAMQLGGASSSFSASLYITPAEGSLLVLTWSE